MNGDFAYLGGEYESLTVVDVGDSASPTVVATLDLDYSGLGVQLVGTDLYLCLGTGLSRIDVSDPTHPVQTGLNRRRTIHGTWWSSTSSAPSWPTATVC